MRADAGVVTRAASDQRLVEQVRAGSHPAFETLFYRHHQGVLAFCARMLGSQVEAEDAAQQTFLAAYRDLARAGQPVEFRPWLYGIARHRCLMALRHRRERPIGVVGDPGGSYDLTAEVGVRADMRALLADVARLPEEQRGALVLAELGGFSHEEIARVLGCPRTKIKALVFQARASLNAAREARETPCAEIREQLTSLRGPALKRATLRRHVSDCPGCRAYRDALRRRRREFGARLPWGLAIALKRWFGAAGSGTGAVTGGGLGEAGVAALVAVTVAASGGGPAAAPSRQRGEPVGGSVHAAPASFVARQMEARPSVDRGLRPSVPGAARRGGGNPGHPAADPGETASGPAEAPGDPGGMVAVEDQAPDDVAADDDRGAGKEPVAEIWEPFAPNEAAPSQPLAPGAGSDAAGVRAPALPPPLRDAAPVSSPAPPTPLAPQAPVTSTVGDEPARQQAPLQTPLRAETDSPQPPPLLRAASKPPSPSLQIDEHRVPSVPSRPVAEHAQSPSSPGRANDQARSTRPQEVARPSVARRPPAEARSAAGHQAPTAPSGDGHRQPAGTRRERLSNETTSPSQLANSSGVDTLRISASMQVPGAEVGVLRSDPITPGPAPLRGPRAAEVGGVDPPAQAA